MLLHKLYIYMLQLILVFWCLRNVCFIVIFIECCKCLVSQKNRVCVCVCVCVCLCVCVCTFICVCTHMVTVKYFAFVSEQFFASCFIQLLMFYHKMYWMFYVNDKPEGKFLNTETINLLHCKNKFGFIQECIYRMHVTSKHFVVL